MNLLTCLGRLRLQLPVSLLLCAAAVLAQSPPAAGIDSATGYVENRGQWPADVHYRAAFGPLTAWVHGDGWTLQAEWSDQPLAGPTSDFGAEQPVVVPRTGAVVRMRVVGGAATTVHALDRANPASINYLIGNDRSRWVTEVRSTAAARLQSLLPGIDAVVRRQDGHFEYDLAIAAGVNVRDAVVRCEGIDALELQPDGSLLLHTEVGAFRQLPPIAWTECAGGPRPVRCAVRLVDARSFCFEAPERDLDEPLVIDPGIVWAAVLGTFQIEHGAGCKPGRDAAGNVYFGGITTSPAFPTTVGAYQTSSLFPGAQKGWLAKYSPNGVLLWATYLGGSTNNERVRSLSVAPDGVVTACGASASTDFPQVNAFDPTFNGAGPLNWGDTWLARIDPSLTGSAQLLWSTYVGGSDDERLDGVHVAGNGIVTASGWTFSSNIPGVSLGTELQPFSAGSMDGFVVRLDPSLPPASQLQYFTFFGGSDTDYLNTPLVDANGVITLYGATRSADLPTTANAFSTTMTGANDQIVVRIDPAVPPAGQLLYSTFIGGTGDDYSVGRMVMDDAGIVTCVGWSQGAGFPTTAGAYDTTPNGDFDVVAYRLDLSLPAAAQLLWSTYFGGTGTEGANDCVLDPDGGVVFVGSNSNGGLPTTPTAVQPVFAGGGATPADAFIARLDRTGSQLVHASYLGGAAGVDFAYGVVFDPCGDVFMHGLTESTNFPSTSGNYIGAQDIFLARLDLLPPTMSRFGTGTAGCTGVPQASTESRPMIGNAQFGLSCIGAPIVTIGLLAWSDAALAAPLSVLGADVWVDPTAPSFALLAVVTDATGRTFQPLPMPNNPTLQGLSANAQFAFLQNCAPGLLSSSCGLSLTIE